jgi:hypothetical protein
MAALLPRSTVLLGLALLLACDRAPGDPTTSKAKTDDPATKTDAKTEMDTKTDAKTPTEIAKTPTEAGAAAVAGTPVAAVAVGSAPAPVAEGTVVNGISIVTHKTIAPKRTGDSKEDYWTQYRVWGEITNHSSEVMEMVTGTITFHDASGAMIGIDSIGTAVKEDVGDTSPGETILASVHFVEPGQTVPFDFTRNLDAIKGEIASHRLYPRSGMPATNPPKGVAVDVSESFEGEDFSRKRMFKGTIRNDGEGSCRAPAFVVAFLDTAGKVAHIDSFDASDDLQKLLAKGESIAFSGGVYVTGEDAWRETARVKTFVDCQPIY